MSASDFLKELNNCLSKDDDMELQYCLHPSIDNINGKRICNDCYEIIQNVIDFEPNKINDHDRSHYRYSSTSKIKKDELSSYGLSDNILNRIINLYNDFSDNKIFRGKTRKAIICSCIYFSFLLENNPQDKRTIYAMFKDIPNNKLGQGFKAVNLYLSENRIPIKSAFYKERIYHQMGELNSSQTQINEVLEIFNRILNQSSLINRVKHHSLIGGVIYFWILKEHISISLDDFAKKFDLSEFTILKISNEIERVYSSQN